MRPLAAITLFIVGGAVYKTLDFVLFLRKLPLDLFFLRLQLLNSFLVHDFNLLTVITIDTKRPPTFSVDGLTCGMGFSDFAMGMVCASRPFSLQSALG